jgi:AGZA family xanthine/uracil permease-like MFS transporter
MAAKSSGASSAPAKTLSFDGWFEISKRKSNLARETRGGLVTFFTMAYIIALNPIILGTGTDKNGFLISGELPDADGAIARSMAMVAAATALVAGVITILMGVVGRYPVALATGLGINSMVASVLAKTMTWGGAMGLIVWEGIIITLLVFTGFREAVFRAVPKSLRVAISVGIGMFIALVGLADAGIVHASSGIVSGIGSGGSLRGFPMSVFVIGFFLLLFLWVRKVKGSMLIAIIGATALAVIVQAIHPFPSATEAADGIGWALNVPAFPDSIGLPDLGLLGKVNMAEGFQNAAGAYDMRSVLTGCMFVFTLLLADFFDTMGTVVAIGTEGDLLDKNGEPPHLREILAVDSLGAVAGGLGAVSSNTSYIESTAGVADGARTGFANVVTGGAFLLSVFISPVIGMVPSEAVAPALFFVGFLMLQQVTEIPWTDLEQALPAFMAIVLMPFGYSITTGIGTAFITYVLLKAFLGKFREVHPLMWVTSALFVVYFVQGPILDLIAGTG